jgi:membrane protein YdbS with pleckstrin-like domain
MHTDPEPVLAPAARSALPRGPQRLDPRVVNLWRLSRMVRWVTFFVPVVLTAGFFGRSTLGAPLTYGLGAGLLGLQLVLALLWPALEHAAYHFEVREHDLLVQSGVLFRRWSSIPLTRIQHVDTRQGPLERLVGLAQLQVYTAAGMSADGSVPGLDQAEAERLRDALSRRGTDDGV